MPIVSIIIPTYNRAKLISRAIKSVLCQSYEDFELIIVDDGSIDNTEQVVAGFKDKRIRYFKLKVNRGQNPALNFGVNEAKGKYIAFLDSDDEWLHDFLKKTISVFKQDPSLGVVYSRAYGCSNRGQLSEGYQFHLQGDIYKEVLGQGYLSYMITILVKKEIIDLLKPNVFDPTFVYGQDDDFCFRLAKICRVGLIKEPLAIIHNDGDINGSEPSICKNVNLIAEGRQKLLDKYKEDVLKYCGKDVLASKYLSISKVYLNAGNIEMAKFSCFCSYNVKKSFLSVLYLIYYQNSFLRSTFEYVIGVYRFFKFKIIGHLGFNVPF